jgi:hypothetical protein
MSFLLVLETFLNGILVRAREGSEDQFPSIRVPGMDGQVIALGDNVYDMLNVAEIDVRVDALCVII